LVTFKEFREYCKRLDGQILQTEGKGKPFSVSVDDSSLRFIPASGKVRTASPKRIEMVLDLLAKSGDWSPTRYSQITYNSSYILGVAKHQAEQDGDLELEKRSSATPHTNDYCEVWGQTGWRRVTVASALARPSALTRCIECRGAVRLHVAGPGGVPRAHAEHREGHKGCSLGHYFSGVRSQHPNSVSDPALGSNESRAMLIKSQAGL